MFGSSDSEESDVESIPELEIPRFLRNIDEVNDPVQIKFAGNIPKWIKGNLFSSGPGTFHLEEGSVGHWVDGYSIISKFEIDGQNLKFSSKYIQTKSYEKALAAQKPVVPEWGTPAGTDDSKGYLSMLAFAPGDTTDNCVGQFLRLGSKLYSVSYSPYFHEINPDTLSVNETLYSSTVFGLTTFTPESIKDSKGDIYIMGAATAPTFRHVVLKMTPENEDKNFEDDKFKQVGIFPSRWSFGACGNRTCFAVTENYVVFIEAPWVINILRVSGTYLRGYAMKDWLDWRPEEGTRFYIMHKETGEVIETEIFAEKVFVTSAIINAYEEGDKIIFDIFSIPDPSPIDASTLDLLQSFEVKEDYTPGEYHRYIIPVIENIEDYPEETSLLNPDSPVDSVEEGKAEAKRVGDQLIVSPELIQKNETGFDFGVVNSNFMGKKHSYVYAVSSPPSKLAQASISGGIAKVDLDSRKILSWETKPGQNVVEPVFVANPNCNKLIEEDNGVLVSLVKNQVDEEQRDFLVVIDAKSMKELGRAEFELEFDVAAWFHAAFYNN